MMTNIERIKALETRVRALELRIAEERPLPKVGDGTFDVYGEFGINEILEFVEAVAPGMAVDQSLSPELRQMAGAAVETLQSLERMPR